MEPSSASRSWESSPIAISTDSSARSVAPSRDQKKDDSGERLIAPEEDSQIIRVSTGAVDSIIESMADPVNRFYRYPAARAMLPIFGRFQFITPNRVTYAHILIGLVASGLVAF